MGNDIVSIYCRLSDEDRNKPTKETDSESIQNQKNMLTKYAIEQGWSIYKIYSDDDYTGTDKDRPEFNKLIKDAEDKKFNIILCKSQARFTRDMELVEKYLHNLFFLWGIRFIGLTDNADTFNKGNKKQRQILGLTNEWYLEDLSDSVRSVFDYKRKEGQFIGSFASYGYIKDPQNKNKLIIDEEAAKVVRLIFNLYLEGHGAQNITYQLNKKEIPNPTIYKQNKGLNYINSSMNDNFGLWNKTTVRRILTNPLYIGHMVQAKRKKISYKSKKFITNPKSKWLIIENTHPPIIDNKTFEEVQNRISKNQRSDGNGKAHIFATKVKCADCKSNMNKVTVFPKRGGKYSYLRCKLYAITPSKKMCTSHSIRLDKLQEKITQQVRERINQYSKNDIIALRLESESNKKNKLDSLIKELKKTEKEFLVNADVLKNLYIDKVKGIISEEEFISLKNNFEAEKTLLYKRKEKIEKDIADTNKEKNNTEEMLNIIEKYKGFEELTHTMVGELIDCIEIGERDKKTGQQKIHIHWLY